MTPLYAELNRWLAVPHQWGVDDCCTLPADWVRRWHGVDPAEDLRLTYASLSECQRVTRFFTDPVGLLSPRLERAGLARTASPVPGDVGVVLIPFEGRPMPHGALCLGSRWAVKTVSGAVHAGEPLKLIAAWGVAYAHP